jgi:magnesium chelatase subunit I
MHYGLLPRANRGIFAINELPDLAGKIQVGLFNILQEGDVQIKGYPVRLAARRAARLQRQPGGLHGARQDHHAAQGPHRLRDPHALPGDPPRGHGDHRAGGLARRAGRQAGALPIDVPAFVREVVEEVAFQARQDSKIDKRSGVSQRLPISLLENVVSNAERRALLAGEPVVVPRITDVYAALPAITGKFELEYEGELRGADNVARDIIRAAVAAVFSGYFARRRPAPGDEWFDLGGTLQVDDTLPAASCSSAPRRSRACAS